MPWNVLDRLEEICIYFNKNNIKTIKLSDLEKTLMRRAHISKKKTVDNHIRIMVKFGWIQELKISKDQEMGFKITYYKDKGDLF